MTTSFLTDHYELTMLDALVLAGRQNDPATAEAFTRKLPEGRRYGVFAGLGRLLPLIKEFEFIGDDLKWLRTNSIVSRETYDYLSNFTFTGTIEAYREGELFFPYSPILSVTGTLGECLIMETLILSVLNFDSAIATTAARMVSSARGRPLIEMGSRRTHEQAAVAAARAAYLAGFASTSNLEAGRTYGVPTQGTAAHAFTLAFNNEKEAFAAQVARFGPQTTLLVDTYDTEQGIRNAVEAAGSQLRAIRIDSGDLEWEARRARKLLDELGCFGTKVIVTSDLTEFVIKDLQDAPIDGYGAGTKLVASQPMGMVYKLVERRGEAVAKKSKDKVSMGGRKQAYRLYDDEQKVKGEVFMPHDWTVVLPDSARPLQHVMMFKGRTTPIADSTLEETREFHARVKDELPIGEQKVWYGDHGPFITAERVSP